MTIRFPIQLVCACYMCRTFIGYPEAVDNTHTHAYLVVCSRMPRVYVRKTDKGQVPREVVERAIQAVKKVMPVRKAATTYSIARTTLNNNLVKSKHSTATLEPNYKHSQIFNQEQETSLANYLERCSGMFHGLTTKNVRTLAYGIP